MEELFGDVLSLVETQYVTPVDDKKLIQAAIDGMVTSLDPHSGYLAPDDYSDMEDQTRGSYGGLGLEVTSDEGAVKIISPIDDTPAARAGLQSGDYITSIDGKSLIGLPLNDAVKKMRGTIGAPITLTLVRPGKPDPFDVHLVRESINITSAKGHLEGDVGYLRISSFDEKTTDEAVAAIKSLEAKDSHIKGWVLDLRNNPGGLLDQAVSVSSAFLPRGEVVSTRGRNAEETQRFTAHGGDLTKGKPLVVLVNGGSASASEIVAGALHDHKRATIIGTRSFGKGSVQTIIPLGAGNGALALTTARYFTPSGHSIQALGIKPDIEVLQDVPDDLKGRVDFKGEASMRGHLSAEGTEQSGSQAYVPPDEKDDKALAAAYNFLRGVTVVNADVRSTPKSAVPN